MARFQIYLLGSNQAPVVEVVYGDLRELSGAIERSRFLEGRLVEIDDHGLGCDVLIAISRIQMISEIDS